LLTALPVVRIASRKPSLVAIVQAHRAEVRAVMQAQDLPVLDGVASLVIGFILALTAAFLAYECQFVACGE
jgi:hypothetical protein